MIKPFHLRELLLRIHRQLEADPRFVAAWLGGSYGRAEQDAVSDLDLFVVVKDASAFPLCRRQAAKASGTTPERFAIFQQFQVTFDGAAGSMLAGVLAGALSALLEELAGVPEKS